MNEANADDHHYGMEVKGPKVLFDLQLYVITVYVVAKVGMAKHAGFYLPS